jgi:hypothetical protein
MRIRTPFLALTILALTGSAFGANPPEATISNGLIEAKIYLPDAKHGYYRGTRFDWSGVVYSLKYKGHDFYGPWYQEVRPEVVDFIYDGAKVVTGAASSIPGPVEEHFTGGTALGFEDARAGGTFIKIGVGILRRTDEKPYNHYTPYPVVDPGKWSVRKRADSIDFIQTLKSPDGYGYVYTKTLRLAPGAARMTIEHKLKNTGTRLIETDTYNHNFLVVDGQGPKPGDKVTAAFNLKTPAPLENDLAVIDAKSLIYKKPVEDKNRVFTMLEGYSKDAKDFDFTVEKANGTGFHVTANRPVTKAMLWSIRSVMSIEPYVSIQVEPGKETAWTLTYDYFAK